MHNFLEKKRIIYFYFSFSIKESHEKNYLTIRIRNPEKKTVNFLLLKKLFIFLRKFFRIFVLLPFFEI
ncbi:MAG: hypothetical protein DRZ79_05990 [Candidatus Cloacimonadota bacterium]|nr:MAG: hypothetical protein DRZ79_05990 [Candidatus Cloacimonadota bacterium]